MARSTVVAVALIVTMGIGCTSRPRAPKLVNESIYQNDEAGFRLEIPDGWSMHAKTLLPPGQPATKERKLVGYKLHQSATPSSLEISCIDLPDGADSIAHFTGGRTGPDAWRPLGAIETIGLADIPARRVIFELGSGAEVQRKEVMAVHRAGRTYFFTLITSPTDLTTRDAVRAALNRISWKPN